MQVVNISKSYDNNFDRYEMISNSIQEILKKLGLTKNESKVYAYLSKNGPTKAKIIAQNQEIPRTQTYHLLNELQNKGIVTMTSGTPTKFEGIEFEKALDVLINNKIKRIEELQLMRDELHELWKAKF